MNQLLIGSYCNRADAETASNVMTSAGLDRRAISFIGKDSIATQQLSCFYKTNGQIHYWGRQQSMWDQDLPTAALDLPEFGSLLASGPLAQGIVEVIEKATHGSGLGALEIGLARLGIPMQSIRQYEFALKTGKFLLIFHGTEKEVTEARGIVHELGPSGMDCHIIADLDHSLLDDADLKRHTVVAPIPMTRLVMSKSRHILFPMDFSERAKGLLPYVGNIARKFGGDVTLLHVLSLYEGIHPGPDIAALDFGTIQAQVREQGEAELLRLSAVSLKGVSVIPVVERGDIAQCIASRVKEHDIGLIVIPTHGRGKFRQLLLGSVTVKVLHDNACPVWTTIHTESATTGDLPEIRNIVCAVDAGPDAHRVLEAAADLASVYGAAVSLVHASQIQQDAHLTNPASEAVQEQIMMMQHTAGTEWPFEAKTGSVPQVLRDCSLERRADLVIIGRGRLTRCTHVEAIIRDAACAVLSV